MIKQRGKEYRKARQGINLFKTKDNAAECLKTPTNSTGTGICEQDEATS